MLSQEDHILLTQTDAGTPMGDMARRYWIPALLSDELPEPDGTPVNVLLLGEQLVAFRDTNGNVGLLREFCAHRGASLAYARNEECGLRCIYHGWKYDVNGVCVDMPSEPPDSQFREKVHQKSYPVFEDGGLVWAYMGPAEKMPPRRTFIWNSMPASHTMATKILMECNYLQGVESGIDTAHVSFLHRAFEPGSSPWGFSPSDLTMGDTAPRLTVQATRYGFRYASIRTAGEEEYLRITPFILPWHTFIPETANGHGGFTAFVPRDDRSHWAFEIHFDLYKPIDVEARIETLGLELDSNFQKRRNPSNKYLQDRDAMKTKNFTGIYGIINQDQAVQETMGPIVDRTQENLGTTDKAIIAMRQLLLESVGKVADGKEPMGLDPSIPFHRIRGEALTKPAEQQWENVSPLDEELRPI